MNFEISGNPQERLSLGTPTILNDSEGPELDHVTLASTTEGYSISDLKDLVHAATQQAVIRGLKDRTPRTEVEVEMEDFVQAHAAFTPVSLRGVTLQKSSVAWSDIGGKCRRRRVDHMHLLTIFRTARTPPYPPRDAGMADQVRPNLRLVPAPPTIRSLTLRVPRVRQDPPRLCGREGMRAQLYFRQGARDTEQVHWRQ